ncbi:hypothetical protein BOTBODRAFT_498099 [Botryobasidium botryosum FD-172 SS1]|uniref:MYND-type domain-containing protein n=1 Tax=Botryobasidium botryosum (strain FD-172 SS1) TaxID=930990 RepID=A0A067MEN5_BOTB1|nr:hypothetical protein BOTBODRAFT_498099 [Botryobasidium botryosum FD-172 SS1]
MESSAVYAGSVSRASVEAAREANAAFTAEQRDCVASSVKAMGGRCAACGVFKKREDIKYRGGCRIIQYCSSGCQNIHWPSHKPKCKGLTEGDRGYKDPVLQMAWRFSSNELLKKLLDVYIIHLLDLNNTPSNIFRFVVRVRCSALPADIMRRHGRSDDPVDNRIMFAIDDIQRHPMQDQQGHETIDLLQAAIQQARQDGTPELCPVVLFSNESYRSSLVRASSISLDALALSRSTFPRGAVSFRADGGVIESDAMVDIRVQLNLMVEQDKEDKFKLRMRLRK